mmetsp:Transcript_58949/g.164728  ORF Transcript_58949/g.164728 Transcript_58949/m.164728 type:complete len:195 (-) Transcript_58949:80-664(-)
MTWRLRPANSIIDVDADEPPGKRPHVDEDLPVQADEMRLAWATCGDAAVTALFIARGLKPALAQRLAAVCSTRTLARSGVRNLAAALGRSPPLMQQLTRGELSLEAFVDLPTDALATQSQRMLRQQEAEAARQAVTVDAHAEAFKLVCDECGAEDARGSWILSTSGGKPMLGSARAVKRGECVCCGHVWLDEGR